MRHCANKISQLCCPVILQKFQASKAIHKKTPFFISIILYKYTSKMRNNNVALNSIKMAKTIYTDSKKVVRCCFTVISHDPKS